jgi:hypothetical protein
MTAKALALGVVAAAALAPAVRAAPGHVEVLGTKTRDAPAVDVFVHTPATRQPYSAFGIRVRAPKGQKVTAHWSIGCDAGSSSRLTRGNVELVGRGAVASTFWRRPALREADTCEATVIVLRGPHDRGAVTVTILGRVVRAARLRAG